MKVIFAGCMHKLGDHMYGISNVKSSYGKILQSPNHATIFCRINKQLAIYKRESNRRNTRNAHRFK